MDRINLNTLWYKYWWNWEHPWKQPQQFGTETVPRGWSVGSSRLDCMVPLRFHRDLTGWQVSSAWNIKGAELKNNQKKVQMWLRYMVNMQTGAEVERGEQHEPSITTTLQRSRLERGTRTSQLLHVHVIAVVLYVIALSLYSFYSFTLSGHHSCVNDSHGFAGAMTKKKRSFKSCFFTFLLRCSHVIPLAQM